jgi:hypothetical protein
MMTVKEQLFYDAVCVRTQQIANERGIFWEEEQAEMVYAMFKETDSIDNFWKTFKVVDE